MELNRKATFLITLGAFAAFSFSAQAAQVKKQESIKLTAEAGLGYDSNIFRTHNGSYTDSYPATPVVVNPVVQTGFFVPYKLGADYTQPMGSGQDFLAQGKFSGEQYFGISNANGYDYAAKLGLDNLLFRKGKLEDKFYVGVFLGSQKKVYVDRDNGGMKTTRAGANISNRYSYSTMGLELDYRVETQGAIRYGVNGLVENRSYADPVVVSQYSHNRTEIGADAEYIPSTGNLYKLAYKYVLRDFTARHARDINGTYATANPMLKYTDHDFKFYWRNHEIDSLIAYLDLDMTSHSDSFVNYTGYTETGFGTRLIYYPADAWKARLSFSKWNRNYANAFAYDNPAQARLSVDGSKLTLKGEYELEKDMTAWAEVENQSWNTNDLRYDYSRSQIMVGISIEH